jgi:hypothetical protein
MKKVSKPAVRSNADSEALIPLTALEVAHILMALEHDDCEAEEVFHPLMAKLGYYMAIAYANQ